MDDKDKNTGDNPDSNQEKNKANDKKWSDKKKSARIRSEALKKIIRFYEDNKPSD